MKRIKPCATWFGALVMLSSLGVLGPATGGFAAAANAPRARGLTALGRKTPSPVHVQVLEVADYMLTVTDLDRSVAFYHDVIGLTLLRPAARPVANALEQSLTNTPGARFRSAIFVNPAGGPPLVLKEFTGIARRTLRPRAVDPGAATVQIGLRNLAPVLAAAAHAHVPFVTRGGFTLPIDQSGTRGIVLRDPDGFYVRLSQPPDAAAADAAAAGAAAAAAARSAGTAGTVGTVGAGAAPKNVLGLRVQYTVAAPAAIVRFYHDVLGLRVQAGTFTREGNVGELFDVAGAQRALTQAAPSGSPAHGNAARDIGGSDSSTTASDTVAADSALQFAAFRGVPRHTYGGRPQDAGTPAVALRVNDLTAALRAIRASGTLIVSAGGQPVLMGRGGATILVRDPAGLLVQLIQEPAGK